MNKDKIRELAEHIVEHPNEFDMDYWAGGPAALDRHCGTVACLAGTACIIEGKTLRRSGLLTPITNEHGYTVSVPNLANDILDLTDDQGDRLWFLRHWPRMFAGDYENAVENRDWAGAACVAARRLHHFVATDGKE